MIDSKEARRDLFRYARRLRDNYYPENEARVLFQDRAESYFSTENMLWIFEKVWSSPQTHFRLTELGNSERFVAQHGEDIRFCHEKKTWLIWDDKRWSEDRTERIQQLAKVTIRSIAREAQGIQDAGLREEVEKFARKSETTGKLNSMARHALSFEEVAVVPEHLDSNPLLLNCENGTIDLRTGKLRPHRRDDLITKVIPVEYDPDARYLKWEEFLLKIMGRNWDLIYFLQRAVGYALTGDTRERCLFFLLGPTATGKTTFIETIRALLGDYAKATDFETFVYGKRQGAIRNDIARLEKTRFASAVEARRGDKLDEQMVKMVTGRDTFMARFLYQEFFEFKPEFKIFLAANHQPKIEGVDEAIWNRFHVVPFEVQIPQGEQDKKLPDKLRKELKGILAWAVRGCLEWQKLRGLQPPEEVLKALKVYREESDQLYRFLADRCLLNVRAIERSGKLYAEYQDWCTENGEEDQTQKRFGMLLQQRDGIERGKYKQFDYHWGYKGIRLKSTMREQLIRRHEEAGERSYQDSEDSPDA